MAKWVDLSHHMRRRMGAPSNHFEAAGPTEGRDHDTVDEQYSKFKGEDSPRASIGEEPMGSDDHIENSMSPEQDADMYESKAAKPQRGSQMKKKNTQAGDPTISNKANRKNVPYAGERGGARYRIEVPYTPTTDPAAGPTMRNARIVPSVQGRQNPNFEQGMKGSY